MRISVWSSDVCSSDLQIHGANGYLIDEFLRDGVNRREDAYGGPPENRVRLLREITQAVADAIGADRTAVRLALNGDSQGTDDTHPPRLAPPMAHTLAPLRHAFLALRRLNRKTTV